MMTATIIIALAVANWLLARLTLGPKQRRRASRRAWTGALIIVVVFGVGFGADRFQIPYRWWQGAWSETLAADASSNRTYCATVGRFEDMEFMLISFPAPIFVLRHFNGLETLNASLATHDFDGAAFEQWLLSSSLPIEVALYREGELVWELRGGLLQHTKFEGKIVDQWHFALTPVSLTPWQSCSSNIP